MGFLLDKYYHFLISYFSSKCSYLIFFITSKCNARCKMCFYWKEIEEAQQKKELALWEIELIAKNFRHLAYLSITGGEPTLREDLDDIIYNFYKYSGTRFVSFSTNGLLPEKAEEAVISILRKCPNLSLKVNLSIDHIEDKHDKIRGINGCFKKTVETFSKLNNLKYYNKNLYLSIGTVLSSYNKNEIFEIINYVEDNFKPDAHSIDLVRGNTREEEAKNITAQDYKRVLDYVKTKTKRKKSLMPLLFELMLEINFKTLEGSKMILPCVAGRKILSLTDDGQIIPCEMLKQMFPERSFVIGDIREADYNINRVLDSQAHREIMDFIKTSKCHCTFECATLWNIILNFKMFPKILIKRFF